MYRIPIKNSLITAHKNPDGDALSSCRAVADYIKEGGKQAAIRLCGSIPAHLEWVLTDEEMLRCVPMWVEQVIVLDSSPSEDRLGWHIPDSLPVVNIDHHPGVADIKNKKYISNRSSTAAALLLDFNINRPILIVGIYTDTLFVRAWGELRKCFEKLEISDEEAEGFLTNVRPMSQNKILNAIREAKVHHTRNGFIIAEVDEVDPAVLEEIMQTLHRYSESVCLMAGNGLTKLRTSNPTLDLSRIAELFGGGGHKFAAVCNISGGRATALKTLIRSLEIKHIDIEVDKHINVDADKEL